MAPYVLPMNLEQKSITLYINIYIKRKTLHFLLESVVFLVSRIKRKNYVVFGEFFSAGKSKIGMGGLLHDKSGERNWVLHGGDAGDGAASPAGPIHDAGLHLHRPFLSQCRSTARIKQRIRFQFPYLYIHIHTSNNKSPR